MIHSYKRILVLWFWKDFEKKIETSKSNLGLHRSLWSWCWCCWWSQLLLAQDLIAVTLPWHRELGDVTDKSFVNMSISFVFCHSTHMLFCQVNIQFTYWSLYTLQIFHMHIYISEMYSKVLLIQTLFMNDVALVCLPV